MTFYRQRMAKYYNSRVKSKEFRIDYLLLWRTKVSQPIERGKLSPNWEDPYQVNEVVRPETYKLKQLDGTPLQRSWNLPNLHMYYQ